MEQEKKKTFIKILKNKYFIVTVIFVVLIVFLEQYNLITTARLRRDVRNITAEEQRLKKAIVHDSVRVAGLKGNIDAIERYGREEYMMKRHDEDVFIVDE